MQAERGHCEPPGCHLLASAPCTGALSLFGGFREALSRLIPASHATELHFLTPPLPPTHRDYRERYSGHTQRQCFLVGRCVAKQAPELRAPIQLCKTRNQKFSQVPQAPSEPLRCRKSGPSPASFQSLVGHGAGRRLGQRLRQLAGPQGGKAGQMGPRRKRGLEPGIPPRSTLDAGLVGHGAEQPLGSVASG